jgi:Flp pilus assembly protein TadG
MIVARMTRRRKAVAAFEAAIVLGVFLTLVLGMIELGICVFRYHLVAEAAREGARQTLVHGEYSASPWGPATVGPINGNDPSPLAQAVMPMLVGVDPETVTILAEWLDGDNEVDHRVRVTVTIQQALLLPSLLGINSLTLSSQTTMQITH